MFVKFGTLWINPAHIETIRITDEADMKPVEIHVYMHGGQIWHGDMEGSRALLDLLGIATRPADIIREQIAGFVANNPGVEYGVARLVFGQGNLTDTAIRQVLEYCNTRILESIDTDERTTLSDIKTFLHSLLMHTESDRIAAMEAVQGDRK